MVARLRLYIDAWVGAQGPRDATRGGGEFLGFAGEEGTGTSPLDRGETGTVDRRSTRSCVVGDGDGRLIPRLQDQRLIFVLPIQLNCEFSIGRHAQIQVCPMMKLGS